MAIPENERGNPDAYAQHIARSMGRPAKLRYHAAAEISGPLGGDDRCYITTCVVDMEPLPSERRANQRVMHEQRISFFKDGEEIFGGILTTVWVDPTETP